jgi:hydrogenase maturation protein HypF
VSSPARARVRARVEGVVQGVGFRPFVHRLAREHTLDGWVRNDARGVLLEVEGEQATLERFLARLSEQAPQLALVESVRHEPLRPIGERGFRILQSTRAGAGATLVSADVAPCHECLAELLDPGNRRYRYPFINCTACGPRFTIIRGVPYDRPRTTMAGFEMCAACAAEYADPASRRFHAQPNACAECGPSARLIDRAGGEIATADPVAGAAAALLAGQIVAVKGVGGYQLACRADDARTLAELRRRKGREEKPFALMAADLEGLRELVALSPAEHELVCGRERPVVIAPRLPGAPVAAGVADGSRELGVMLPSTPLHHLLLADVGRPLVMTSGNLADEPIAFEDEDALARLASIAELFLLHDRPIHVRADDSVVRALAGASRRPLMIRRARGYVPGSLSLPLATPPLLACGAELKSTFCLANGSRAWVGAHVGDLRNWQTLRSFGEGIAHLEALFSVEPEVLAHDLHPDYLSTAYALRRTGVELVGVQHHHAHLAACLAEHGEHGPAIGAIYDGSGLGSDGSIWGGELLVGDLERVERAGHLQPVRLPGGDAAVREPWRMACAWLLAALDGEAPLPPGIAGRVDPRRWERVAALARSGLASPVTTSVGRLFDAVAALCGIRMTVREEGRAAAELEAAASPLERRAYPMPVVDAEVLRLDARETVRAIIRELSAGVSPALVSARFHNGLADATARAVALLAERHGVRTAVLSGGVFQNRLLLERCADALAGRGLRVLIPQRLPPNDGGIAYGQAAVAAARLRASPCTASASASIVAATSGESPLPASKFRPSTP